MGLLKRIALPLVIIGAINWGLIGLFKFDLVAAIFGGQTAFLSRVIYSLVGLSGLACIPLLFSSERDDVESVSPQRYGRLDYSTEFADENDLSDMYTAAARREARDNDEE